jgi:hypothetical protein
MRNYVKVGNGEGTNSLKFLVRYLIFVNITYTNVTGTCQNKCFISVTAFSTYIYIYTYIYLFPLNEVSLAFHLVMFSNYKIS